MIKRIDNYSLLNYLEENDCEIVGKGIFFHFLKNKRHERPFEIAEIIIPSNLDISTCKMSDLHSTGLIIEFTQTKHKYRPVQRKIYYLKGVFQKYLSDNNVFKL